MEHREYKIKGETPDKKKKAEYWECAIGLQQVDGLMPSRYLIDLAQDNVDGKITYAEIEELLYKKYENETPEEIENRVRESDLVAARIADILDGGGFSLNPMTLKNIHGILFKDIYKHAGMFRKYNISKDEPVLNGRSVIYADWRNIGETLDYDFSAEREKSYDEHDKARIVKRIANFTSSVWQVHPFMEGNTRTVATFIECYLNNMGFRADNEMFKEHSLYFRNALVVSNYASMAEGIRPNPTPLINFYDNLLMEGEHSLRNRDLLVMKCFPEEIQKRFQEQLQQANVENR